MKKILIFALVLMFLCCFSYTCFAAEENHAQQGNVYAKFHVSNEAIRMAAIKNGKCILTACDGTVFILETEEQYNGYMVAVHLINKKEIESYQWISSCMPEMAAHFLAYYIYMVTPDGIQIELPNETLIHIEESSSDDFILGLSCDGKAVPISSVWEENNRTFSTTQKVNYYVLSQTVHSDNCGVDSPQTGDINSPMIWVVFLSASGALLLITIWITKRKRFTDE